VECSFSQRSDYPEGEAYSVSQRLSAIYWRSLTCLYLVRRELIEENRKEG